MANGELPIHPAADVQPLFSTDFWREKWLVTEGKAVEIALDGARGERGNTRANLRTGLELLEGETNDVLKLARKLVSQSGTSGAASTKPPADIILLPECARC